MQHKFQLLSFMLKIRISATGKRCAYICRNPFWKKKIILLYVIEREKVQNQFFMVTLQCLLGGFKGFCYTELCLLYVAHIYSGMNQTGLKPCSLLLLFLALPDNLVQEWKDNRPHLSSQLLPGKITSVPLLQFSIFEHPTCFSASQTKQIISILWHLSLGEN